MNLKNFSFELHRTDAGCKARRSTFLPRTGLSICRPSCRSQPRPASKAWKSIKSSLPAQNAAGQYVSPCSAPGEETVSALGGLHRFMGWDGPILTDSGGFQLYSLAQRTQVTEENIIFRSHIDGQLVAISPERAVAIQEALGSDVAMALDHVVGLPNKPDVVLDAAERTVRWAKRCQQAAKREDQALFAIVQGGLDVELRKWCAGELCRLDFPGYAIGGLSVGEPPDEMYSILDVTVPELPADKPRYLMGVGRPEDLLEAVRRGIDLFDCVIPTRNGRNAMGFTDQGPLRLRNLQYERDDAPLEKGCPCASLPAEPRIHSPLVYGRRDARADVVVAA